MKVASGTNGCFIINVINVTLQSRASNSSVLTALNYTTNDTNVSAEAILHYACSINPSGIAPFILRNNTWKEINPFTIDAAACAVEFAVPADPVIALLNTNAAPTTTATTAPTTAQAPVSTVPATQKAGVAYWQIIIIIIIIIAAAAALFLYLRTKGYFTG